MAVSETRAQSETPEAAPCPTQPLDSAGAPFTPEPLAPEPVAGMLLGQRYQLGAMIGRGGMSTVHRARDSRTGREVAVKVFRSEMDADERHRREVELLSTLNHPGLVAVIDADVASERGPKGVSYLVTELVDGSTLSSRIRQAPLTEDQVAQLGAVLCSTLAYVHQRGIVHRDVKPANILIPSCEDDLAAAKLADFGIALSFDDARLTADGETVGTANYLSPEQVRGEPVTPATDIYSLGLVLIEALTGELAYPGTGVEAAMARLHRPPAIPHAVSRRLRNVLHRMTAESPGDRPDARQAAATFAELAPEPGNGSLTSDILMLGHPVAEPGPRRLLPIIRVPHRLSRRGAVAAAAAGLLLATGTALVSATTDTGNPGPPKSDQAIEASRQAGPPAKQDSSGQQSPTEIAAPGPAPAVQRVPAPPASRKPVTPAAGRQNNASSDHTGKAPKDQGDKGKGKKQGGKD